MSNEIQKYNFFGFVSNWLFVLAVLSSLYYGYLLFQERVDQKEYEARRDVEISEQEYKEMLAIVAEEKAAATAAARAAQRIAQEKDEARQVAADKEGKKIVSLLTGYNIDGTITQERLEEMKENMSKEANSSLTKKKNWTWNNANNKHLLIQFVNAYYNENNNPYLSDDVLHAKIIGFFNGNLKKTKNAKGWKSFRLNRDRKVAGISVKRFKEIQKDLRNKEYDDIIEDHIYRTEKGQELWMLLRLPYVRKN